MKLYYKNELRLIDEMIGHENEMIELSFNGKKITRRVYYSKNHGLYIRLNNKMIFEYDFRISDTIFIDDSGIPFEE